MSPEQVDADGGTEIDGRSDVYSLACVVYAMLCGRPPFTGKPNAVIRRHLAESRRPLAAVCPGAPPKIGAVLSCALQKAPAAGRGPGRQLRRSGRRREQGERRGGEDADGGETPGEGHGRTLDRPFRGGPGRSPGRFVNRSDHRCTRPEALAGTDPGTPGPSPAFPEVPAPRSAQDGLRGTDEAVPTWETARSAVAPASSSSGIDPDPAAAGGRDRRRVRRPRGAVRLEPVRGPARVPAVVPAARPAVHHLHRAVGDHAPRPY